MKKSSLLLIFLFIPIFIYAQNDKNRELKKELFEELSNEICQCLNKEEKTDIINNLNDCLGKNKTDYDSKFSAIFENDTITDPDKIGDKLGEEFMLTMQEPLMNNCDSYYNYFKDLKDQIIEGFSQFSSDEILANLNKRNPDTTPNYYYERAIVYFAKEDYEKTISDLKRSIEVNPIADKFMLLAWAYEENGELENTLKTLEKYGELTDSNELEIFIALAKRNIRELNESK